MPLPLQLPWPCSKAALGVLFVRASSTLRLIFLFSYVASILLPKVYPLIFSSSGSGDINDDDDDYDMLYEDDRNDYVEEKMEEEEILGQKLGYDYYNASTRIYYDHENNAATFVEGEHVVDGEDTLTSFMSNQRNYNHALRADNQFRNAINDYHSEPLFDFEDEEGENRGEEEEEEHDVEEDDEEENRGEVEEEQNPVNREEDDEEDEGVIVEDITGREHSYLDDDAEAVNYQAIGQCNEGAKMHGHGDHSDHSQQLRGKVIWEIKPASEEEEETHIQWRDAETHLIKMDGKKSEAFTSTDHNPRRRVVTIDEHHHYHHHHHPKAQKEEEREEEEEEEVMFSDSCTNGSTSKSSSDWRSSLLTGRDSGAEDPFFSSRSSCPRWESYTVFHKYDEEMILLDRLCAQKLQEIESFQKALQASQPRSIPGRMVHHLMTRGRRKRQQQVVRRRNPYYELEAAYVAQVCLAWEALSWDYESFRRKQASITTKRGVDPPGCPEVVAQQFQQFQVLLQRYIENEPYEYGRRPEIYARMRIVFPGLLQVPEYQDDDGEQKEKAIRIPTSTFVPILEDSILTFLNFLKADRESSYRAMISSLFGRHQRGQTSIDPNQLEMMKKTNKKKKLKLKQIRRTAEGGRGICSCIPSERNVSREERMEAVMGLIDLKLVTRVLRMAHMLTHEQLKWCETKMAKVSLNATTGRVHRDSTPLFFPAHNSHTFFIPQ